MKTKTRKKFMENYGVFYAALGGTFGAYRTAGEAFKEALKFKPYKQLQINYEQDFADFTRGFEGFQNLRIACQKEKARAEQQNKEILQSVNFDAPNYLYEGE